MATYEGDRDEWLKFLVDAWGGLGPLLGAGMERSEMGSGTMYPVEKLRELGVQELDYWVNPPVDAIEWEAMGRFLHGP